MDNTIYISPDDIEIMDSDEYRTDVVEYFSSVPDVAKPLASTAKRAFRRIEQMLYSTPAFINTIKASIPKEALQAILTDEQKSKLAKGAVKLMTKKDGSLMASLINPTTKKVISNISLEKVKLTPEMSQAITSYVTQMQLAQIAEQIQAVQIAVEEVRQGQEHDRLATAYSCQQKLLQAMVIKNPRLKSEALLRIVFDAEDSRNLLMQSQDANIACIQNEPETFWEKVLRGAKPEEINQRMNELRENLCAVNMVSFVEAMAYQEMGEAEAARLSLQYYARYIQKAYLNSEGFVERLDTIDPSPQRYWSETLPDIERRIQALPCNVGFTLIGENENESEQM